MSVLTPVDVSTLGVLLPLGIVPGPFTTYVFLSFDKNFTRSLE